MTGVVVLSWNVHGWVGSDRVRDPARAFAVLASAAADVVALQEVEGDDWAPLAAEAGYRPIMGRTRPVAFGNALLTRLPVARVRRVDLSVPGREPRGALDAVVATSGSALRVVTTHFGLRASERRSQAARLARHLAEHDAQLPVTLVGDLNDWTPWGRQLRAIVCNLGPLSRIPTFPSGRPVLALDRAAWRTPGRTVRVSTLRTPATRRASDHLPLRLDVGPQVA